VLAAAHAHGRPVDQDLSRRGGALDGWRAHGKQGLRLGRTLSMAKLGGALPRAAPPLHVPVRSTPLHSERSPQFGFTGSGSPPAPAPSDRK
jgi:hypothetical protein